MYWLLLLFTYALHASPFHCHILSKTTIDTGTQPYNIFLSNQHATNQLVGRTDKPLTIQLNEEVEANGTLTHKYKLKHPQTHQITIITEHITLSDCVINNIQQETPNHIQPKRVSTLKPHTHYMVSSPSLKPKTQPPTSKNSTSTAYTSTLELDKIHQYLGLIE